MAIRKRSKNYCVSVRAIRRIILENYPNENVTELAILADCHEDTMRRIVIEQASAENRFTLMDFDKADRILTRMDLQHLWHLDPSLIAATTYLDNHAEILKASNQASARKSARKKAELRRAARAAQLEGLSERRAA